MGLMASKGTPAEEEALEPDEEIEEFAPELQIRRRKSNAGRPPKYRPEYATIARLMLSRGATMNELAEAFGVTNATLYYWKAKYVEFFDVFSEVSDAYVVRAERALAERAVGYTYESVKVFNFKGIPVVVPIKEHVPPDINALKYFLGVKKPDVWKVKDEVEVNGDEAFREIFVRMGKRDGGEK